MADLKLGEHFMATTVKGKTTFYSDNICSILRNNPSAPSVKEIRENIIDPMNKTFGQDMMMLTKGKSERVSIVCKYIGCLFRLVYLKCEKKNEEDGSIEEFFKYCPNGSHKTHCFEAHQNKDLKLIFNELV